jgi:hypothetical protein
LGQSGTSISVDVGVGTANPLMVSVTSWAVMAEVMAHLMALLREVAVKTGWAKESPRHGVE